jgi:hypothetical protein
LGNVVQNVTAKTSDSELQNRNNQDNARVYDPTNNALLQEVLVELKELNRTIKLIYNLEI